MSPAKPKYALRPFLPRDTAALAEIFRESIEQLTTDDYTPSQQEAWIATAEDEADFGARLEECLTLLGTLDGEPVGFASLKGEGHVEMLYVHPDVTGTGVAAMLYDALEKIASSRGATVLTVDASDTAQGFFAKRGFLPQRRNTLSLGNEWLANTTMEKRLVDKAKLS